MSRTELDIRTIPFQCSLASREIEIVRTYKVRIDRRGVEQARVVAGTRCSHMDDCEIASPNASGSSSYDWARCSFMQSATRC